MDIVLKPPKCIWSTVIQEDDKIFCFSTENKNEDAAYYSVRIINLKVACNVILIQYISSMIYFFITKETHVHCIGKYKKIWMRKLHKLIFWQLQITTLYILTIMVHFLPNIFIYTYFYMHICVLTSLLHSSHTSTSSQKFTVWHTFTSKPFLVPEREQSLLLKNKSERHEIFSFWNDSFLMALFSWFKINKYELICNFGWLVLWKHGLKWQFFFFFFSFQFGFS